VAKAIFILNIIAVSLLNPSQVEKRTAIDKKECKKLLQSDLSD
jgi:hypothetical protein